MSLFILLAALLLLALAGAITLYRRLDRRRYLVLVAAHGHLWRVATPRPIAEASVDRLSDALAAISKGELVALSLPADAVIDCEVMERRDDGPKPRFGFRALSPEGDPSEEEEGDEDQPDEE